MSVSDIRKVILYAALAAICYMLWSAWQQEMVSTPQTSSQTTTSNATSADIPAIAATNNNHVTTTNNFVAATTNITSNNLIQVHTDVLNVSIDPVGGNIVKVSLIKYPQELHSSTPFQLMDNTPGQIYVAQSGLVSESGPDTLQGQARFVSAQNNYTLQPGQDNLQVQLAWRNAAGLSVTKTYLFKRNDYLINVNYAINNQTSATWNGKAYAQFKREIDPNQKGGGFHSSYLGYLGAAISSPEKPYEKVTFKDMANGDLNQDIQGGWAAMIQHYFLGAWLPSNNLNHYFSRTEDNGNTKTYLIGFVGPQISVAPKQQVTTQMRLYVGPKITDILEKIAPGLNLTVDYGWFWFISIGLFWLMKKIYLIVGNWGWAIIIITILVKALFYKLSESSYRSMAKMRLVQPKLTALKERYGEDKQKFHQAMLELYRKEKINPVSGCLPIFIQIPVFIALYWVLVESVEFRQAPFILWIHDLSIKDPLYILPILMGLTMFIQQKLSPPPPDPMQAKLMMLLPLFFTALFMNFPAGLVLYWVVSNTLSVLQQWYITRKYGEKKPGRV